MEKNYFSRFSLASFICIGLLVFQNSVTAQCTNADFSNGNFGSWTGTNFAGICTGISIFGLCTCSATDPLLTPGFLQGPNNTSPANAATEYCHVLTTSGAGNDPYVSTLGYNLPVAFPGNSYSARIGNMWQAVTGSGVGDGETMSYSFLVNASNCNFTYHFATVINAGSGHTDAEQPYFTISMADQSGNPITCSQYHVDANHAPTIGGFNTYIDPVYDSVFVRPWSSVIVPLPAYVGQTVTITFTTRGCLPGGCAGSHFAYAYIAAECAPLDLTTAISTSFCGATTITAPSGAASYAWTGPGIVSGGNSQVVTVNQTGRYTVAMTTIGDNPCPFSLDTFVTVSAQGIYANFSATNACVGTTSQFTDLSTPAGQITSWKWDFNNDGVTDATTQNPTYTFASPGTYPVKLTIGSASCTADTTINVVVSPVPDATFTASSPVCEGTNSSIVYTGSDAANDTYTWDFSGGTVASGTGQGPYQVNWLSGGSKIITLTVTAGNCSSAPATQTVVVNPYPGLIAPGDTSVCTGSSVTLVASGATSYTWTPSTGLNSTNTATVIATPPSTTTYTITGASANCNGVATVTVTVNPAPTSTFTVTSPICAGQNSTITYTGNAGAGANYIWNFNGGNATPAGGQGPIQVNWLTAGVQQISLTVSQSGCSSQQTVIPVTVNPGPTSTFTASTPLCINQNGTITYTGSATGAAVYTWGWSGGTVVSGSGAGPYSVNWPAAGTQNVTLSITDNGCSSAITTVPVVVTAIPTSTFTVTTPVCALSGISTLTYTGNASPAATYTWDFAGGTATPGGTTQGPQSVTWNTAGTENVTLSVTENGCTSTLTTQTVVVNNTPTPLFTATGPVCTGQPSTITYTGTGDNLATYTWDFAGGTANPGTGQGPQAVTWNTAGTQNVTLIVSENGCTSPMTTQTVVVNAIPTADFTITSPLCVNQQGTITYTGSSTPSAVFTWNFGGGTTASSTNSTGPVQISWTNSGPETVTLDIADNGCNATQVSMPVTVNAIPVSDAGADVAYCSGSSATIGAVSVSGNTYSWSPATGLSDATSANPTVNLTNSANSVLTQTYIVTTSNSGCTSSDTAVVTVNPVPVAQFVQPPSACLGNSFNFTAGGTFLPSATFAWDFGNYAAPAASTSQSQTVTYTDPTTSAVTLIITQAGGCTSTFTSSVTVYPAPVINFHPDTAYGCENFEVCFINNTTGIAPVTYAWSFGDGETSGQDAPCHLYVAPGVYSVFLQATSSQGCVDTLRGADSIKVIADPKAAFTSNVTVVQQPASEIDFTNQSLNAVTYLWAFSTVGVDNAVLGSSTDISPKYNFTQYGLYNVEMYAYNALGCADSAQENVTVLPPQNYFIPNAFTPNGDGVNDEFYIQTQEGVILREFRVFDRWGEKVHDGIDQWDGTYKGKPAPAGVYMYVAVLHYDTAPGNTMRDGSVTLIR